MIDKIGKERWRLIGEGYEPKRIRITTDALMTVRRDHARNSQTAFVTNYEVGPDTIFGLPIEEVPVGELDAPCFQIMTTDGELALSDDT